MTADGESSSSLSALDEVDDVPCLAGCCCSYVVGTAGGSVRESILSPDVLAGSAAWTASLRFATVECPLAQH